MSSYSDIMSAQNNADMRINKFIFLHIAQQLGTHSKSLKHVKEQLTFNHKALADAIQAHKSYIKVTIRDEVTKETASENDFLLTLTEAGINYFMQNSIILDS